VSPARGALVLALLLAAAATPAAAQGRISNATTETRSAADGLDRAVRAVMAAPGVRWLGYRVPMVAGPRQMCCYDTVSDSATCCGTCRLESGAGVVMTGPGGRNDQRGSRVALEPPSEFIVLTRVEGGSISRVRTFTPDCDIDASGVSLIWFNDVKPDDSIRWLTSLIVSRSGAAAVPVGDTVRARVVKPAIAAIALHDDAAADRALDSFVAPDRPEWLRSDTSFWLGSARGEPGARSLARIMAQDPSDKVRDKATFALSVSKAPSALATLIQATKTDRSTRVRGQALTWLAHKAGQEAVATITNAIENDPETAVKKKAVFALSQLPKDEGVPKLIEVARTNRNPEVRRQAFFWLGQSHDPRAVEFFESVLLRK
jgi:hypothetical protein